MYKCSVCGANCDSVDELLACILKHKKDAEANKKEQLRKKMDDEAKQVNELFEKSVKLSEESKRAYDEAMKLKGELESKYKGEKLGIKIPSTTFYTSNNISTPTDWITLFDWI